MEPTSDPSDRRPALTADNFMMPQKAVSDSGATIPSPTVAVSEGSASGVVDSDFVAVTGQPRSYKLTFDGPGAAAAGSLDTQNTPPTSSAPFNGALQPAPTIDRGGALEEVALDMRQEDDDVLPQPVKAFPRKRALAIGLLVFGCMLAGLLGLRIEANKSKVQNSSLTAPSSKLQQQQIPLTTLNKQLGVGQVASNAVTVNGQLQVTNSLVIQPSTITAPAVTGQIYYDGTTNTLAYYNGTQFVPLQGGGNTYITNVAGSTMTNVANVTNVTNVTNVSGGGFGGTGTPGTLAMFNSATTLGNSLITESGTTLNVGSNMSTTNIQGGSGITLNSGSNALSATAGEVDVESADGVTVSAGAGNVSISTAASAISSGTVTIESGASSSTASGDVTIDTGSGFVSGTVIGDLTFEDNTTDNLINWFSSTISATNTVAHTGSYSLAVTQTSGGNWGIISNENTAGVPVTAGHHVFVSAWVRAATTPRAIGGQVIWYGQGATAFTPVTDTTTGWTEMSLSATVPAGVTRAYFDFEANGVTGETHYFDDIEVTDLSSSASTSSLNLGSTNAQIVNIGNMNELGATTIDGSSGITLNAGAGALNASAGSISISGSASSSLGTSSGSLILSSGGGTDGGVAVTTQTNSTTAFTVQSAGGATTLLNVDSTDSEISLGTGAGSSIGFTGIGQYTGGDINGGVLNAQKVTTTASGTILSMSAYFLNSAAPNNLYQFAIYRDNGTGSAPGAYLASSAIGTMGPSGTHSWYTLPISATLASNTTYWLVFWTNSSAAGSTPIATSNGGAGTLKVNSDAVAWQTGADNGLPATFPSLAGSVAQVASLYASYSSSGPALTVNEFGTMTQNGAAVFQDPTNSTQALQVEDSLGDVLLAADTASMQITIGGALTVTGNITVNGHIIVGGSTPTIAADAGACTGGTASITGNDTAGTIVINTGSSGCSGTGTLNLATITFANAFAAVPTIVLTPGNPISASDGYVDDTTLSTTTFDLGYNATPMASQTYKWNYLVVQ